ncbi:peptide chain release factor 2 [Anoxybacter fermentans]|uniref:Peptide chain release factor 2 n=2 Tax=Anoxybacter fermentans TaxID=1323375 RepID=A0A3S9T2K5_9FIRM|nr:peptide chain release factor 2 [Anoxybacter fermentans]
MSKPTFWDKPEEAQKIAQEASNLKKKIDHYQNLVSRVEDTLILLEMAEEENDLNVLKEVEEELPNLKKEVSDLELKTLLNEEYDANNAILSIHPGAGGTESQDWASMLLRMYTRWAETHGYEIETLEYLPGEEAGIKSVTLLIKGEYAYGYLKGERGVHRLVRISPFDAAGRRHTSFSSVDVLPEIDNEVEVEIDPSELKIDTYRSSGAGGQHVNTTDSAVRITHLPTGIVVQCQNERSQHKNREMAMKILKAKLYEYYKAQKEAEIDEIKGEYKEIAWGNQIRSYVFHPYNMVKDHRTNLEEGNVQKVMDGDIDSFIQAYLKHQKK